MGKMMQNYYINIFLAKWPPEMTPNDTLLLAINNLEIIYMFFKSLYRMSEIHY